MKKYTAAYYPVASPEDAEAGRSWEVRHTQDWQDGRWLPPVAQLCTKDDAERIAACLNACEGVLAENVDVNKLIEDHALLKVRYNNLVHDAREAVSRVADAVQSVEAVAAWLAFRI